MTTPTESVEEDLTRVSQTVPHIPPLPSDLFSSAIYPEVNNTDTAAPDSLTSLSADNPLLPLASTAPIISPSVDSTPSSSEPASPVSPTVYLTLSQQLAPPPVPLSSRPQTSFALADMQREEGLEALQISALPPEIANADIFVAPNFVETSSAAAAREIKRRFDQYMGVDMNNRSPYMITNLVTMYGKRAFRVGDRDASAPNIDGDILDGQPTTRHSVADSRRSPPPPQPLPGKQQRHSRMSVHSFLPPVMFKNGNMSTTSKNHARDGTHSPPRRLRKTRSIPNRLTAGPTEQSTAVLSQSTSRPHAYSISGIDPTDMPVTASGAPERTTRDTFSRVMAWHDSSSFSSSSASHSARSLHSPRGQSVELFEEDPTIITHPFGPGVSYETPSWHPPSHLTSPPTLREMQSFESGLTARADPLPRVSRISLLRARLPDDDEQALDESQSQTPSTPTGTSTVPLADTTIPSRYSTDVFDVLQNYRGLPAADKIEQMPNERTVKLSLKADQTAAPRDDPRFVIWGDVEFREDDASFDRRSQAESSGHSALSRKKSLKDKHVVPPPEVRVTPGEGTKRVMVAATIERWIAQLTSELDYDELLIFFLTYRTYVSAVDLGHLLICRFHWALGQPLSGHDNMVRQIVRARTFLAIRYWLLTFFTVDFVPNRELRLLFAEWLNSLRKDPILSKYKDAQNIVKQLRKVVLDCKNAHTHKEQGSRRNSKSQTTSAPQASVLGDLSNGNFAESMRKAVGHNEEDLDIDLDFNGNEDDDTQRFSVGSTSPGRNPSNSVDLAMLRQPLHLAVLQYGNLNGKLNTVLPATTISSVPMPSPVNHGTFSRVIVNTIGRLGHWKRVLNSRSLSRAPLGACVDVSAFDVEASESRDLLMVKGGVEQYLRVNESPVSQLVSPAAAITALPPTMPLDIDTQTTAPTKDDLEDFDSSNQPLDSVSETVEEIAGTPLTSDTDQSDTSSFLQTPTIADSSSTARESQVSITSTVEAPDWGVDVVSIDDLDLSDLSSGEDASLAAPPGLKKMPRRLPNRRDFEFVRHSIDSVSSMGIRTRESALSASSSVFSSTSASGGPASIGPGRAGPIHKWQIDAIVESLSDEEDSGDVEAALRRLEGQINRDDHRAARSHVDGWLETILQRADPNRNTQYSSEEEDYGVIRENVESDLDDSASRSSFSRASGSQQSSRSSVVSAVQIDPSPAAVQISLSPASKGTQLPARSPLPATTDAKPAVEDAVPLEILQSRVPSRPSTSAGSPPTTAPHLPLEFSMPKKFSSQDKKLKWHRSFILRYRSSSLVQHFSIIDRELFLNVKFEEVVSQEWIGSAEHANILDWGQFLRERARLKAEGRGGHKTSALNVVRGRFNLIANFVQSEIVLTHPSERAGIYSKFVRVAWKSYCLRNFNTLVAVIAGLTSEWTKKAMKHIKPGMWEARVVRDLEAWTTSKDDFKHIRQTVDALAEAKPVTTNPQAQEPSSVISVDGHTAAGRNRAMSEPEKPPSCIPFFGVYLSQVHRYSNLPDLIDPTAPNEPVEVDPDTNGFEPPAHPEVFSTLAPLPALMQLEPLINVQKQRLIAGVVKSLVAGQHLASRVQYPIDRKLFQLCLKLRGLDPDTLQRALLLYS